MKTSTTRRAAAALLALLLAAGSAAAQNCGLRDAKLRGLYDGDCARGWAHGQGKAAGTDRYEGGFLDGHAHGQGTYTFADGSRFVGQFEMGRVTGRARFHYPGGDVLEGEFRDNRLVGVGKMRKAGGETVLVELRGALLLPAQVPTTTQAAAPAPSVAPAPGATPAPNPSPTPGAALAAGSWQPLVDLEDLFPSFILATATRKPVQASAARSVNAARADDLSRSLVPPAQAGATARLTSMHANATYLGDSWGSLGVRVRTDQPDVKATLRVSADEVAEATEETFQLPKPGEYVLYPRLRYRWDALRNVAQPTPITVNWSLALNGVPAGKQSRVVRLRATQDAPWVVVGARGPEFLGWVFTAFVTEDAPWIDEVLGQAFKDTPVRALGYQASEKDVIAQVGVVYDYLRRRGFKYSSITTGSGSGASSKVNSQMVRFPSDSMRTSQANCIDGTVLMASILRKIDIEAYIVTGPGHAMLGFATQRGVKPDDFLKHFIVVETTAVGIAGFDVAVQEGMKKFKTWLEKSQDDLMFDVISVAAARRAGVMPIAR